MAYWILFVITISIVEAFMFHSQLLHKTSIDIHIPLTINRIVVFIGIFNSFPIFEIIQYLFLCVLTFPLLHDGIYYKTRNLLNSKIYNKGFFDQSTTTTAKFSFNFTKRLMLAILGGLIFILLNLF